jgi:hypothetical protein
MELPAHPIEEGDYRDILKYEEVCATSQVVYSQNHSTLALYSISLQKIQSGKMLNLESLGRKVFGTLL